MLNVRLSKNQQTGKLCMKTDAIRQSIINNYKILAERSKVKSNKGDIITIWGIEL